MEGGGLHLVRGPSAFVLDLIIRYLVVVVIADAAVKGQIDIIVDDVSNRILIVLLLFQFLTVILKVLGKNRDINLHLADDLLGVSHSLAFSVLARELCR